MHVNHRRAGSPANHTQGLLDRAWVTLSVDCVRRYHEKVFWSGLNTLGAAWTELEAQPALLYAAVGSVLSVVMPIRDGAGLSLHPSHP
jgi:hypothetical protein